MRPKSLELNRHETIVYEKTHLFLLNSSIIHEFPQLVFFYTCAYSNVTYHFLRNVRFKRGRYLRKYLWEIATQLFIIE